MTSKKAVPARSGLSPASPAGRSGSKTGRQGLYLYCIREKGSPPVKVVKTVDGGGASLVSLKELEAVVGEVDFEKFRSEEIQTKAKEDINWIKEKAQIHEHVIEQAMGKGKKIIPVIPMKFGTIFKTKKSLKGMINVHYQKFKTILENLKGKQEWGVKVYLKEEVFTKHLQGGRMDSLEVKKKKKEIASLPKGADFFAKKKLDEIAKKEKTKELGRALDEIVESLQKLSVKVRHGKTLDRALTGRKEPMVLNASFLVKEEKVKKFRKEAEKLKAKYGNLGLEICESGPWPPYNFVEVTRGK